MQLNLNPRPDDLSLLTLSGVRGNANIGLSAKDATLAELKIVARLLLL
jgi:hypothetical protein